MEEVELANGEVKMMKSFDQTVEMVLEDTEGKKRRLHIHGGLISEMMDSHDCILDTDTLTNGDYTLEVGQAKGQLKHNKKGIVIPLKRENGLWYCHGELRLPNQGEEKEETTMGTRNVAAAARAVEEENGTGEGTVGEESEEDEMEQRDEETVVEEARNTKLWKESKAKPTIYGTKRTWVSMEDGHAMLGHPTQQVMKELSEGELMKMVTIKNVNKSFSCDTCNIATGTAGTFTTSEKQEVVGKVIQMDLAQVRRRDRDMMDDSKWLLVAKDIGSSYLFLRPLKDKTEAAEEARKVVLMMEGYTNKKVETIRTDGGGEFKSVHEWAEDAGKHSQVSAPHAHEQNGGAERMVRTAKAALHKAWAAGVRDTAWGQYTTPAIELQLNVNRVIQRELEDGSKVACTPYQWMRGIKPDATWLPRLGAVVIAKDLSVKTDKGNVRNEVGVVVGVERDTKGYAVFIGDRVKILRDIVYVTDKETGKTLYGEREAAIIAVKHGRVGWMGVARSLGVLRYAKEDKASRGERDAHGTDAPLQQQQQQQQQQQNDGQHTDDRVDGDDQNNDDDEDEDDEEEQWEKMATEHMAGGTGVDSDYEDEDEDEDDENKHDDKETEQQINTDGGMMTRSMRKKTGTRLMKVAALKRDVTTGTSETGGIIYTPKLNAWRKAKEVDVWRERMDNEVGNLEERNTYKKVSRDGFDKGIQVFETLWDYTSRLLPDGSIKRKARLVVNGKKMSRVGVEHTSVADRATIFTILTLAANQGWSVIQADFKAAFLNGVRKTPIYVKCDYISTTDYLEVWGNMYGTPEAPMIWAKDLAEVLGKFGFKPIAADRSVFTYRDNDGIEAWIATYVDDLIITGNNKEWLHNMVERLSKEREMTHGPMDKFLGLDIKRESEAGNFRVSLKSYITEVLDTMGWLDGETVKVLKKPVIADAVAPKREDERSTDNEHYRQLTGTLMYIAQACRFDVAFAANVLCRHVENPAERHYESAKKVFRYLAGTAGRSIILGRVSPGAPDGCERQGEENTISGYSDTDFAGDVATRKSTAATVLFVNGTLVAWSCKRQSRVSRSSSEAELGGCDDLLRREQVLANLCKELGVKVRYPMLLLCDNRAVVLNARSTDKTLSRMRHVEISKMVICDEVQRGTAEVQQVKSEDNCADPGTKSLTGPEHERLTEQVGYVDEGLDTLATGRI
jgi:hypothetical protein